MLNSYLMFQKALTPCGSAIAALPSAFGMLRDPGGRGFNNFFNYYTTGLRDGI
jgi:hypothetical protein